MVIDTFGRMQLIVADRADALKTGRREHPPRHYVRTFRPI